MVEFVYKKKARGSICDYEARIAKRKNTSKSNATIYEVVFYNYSWQKAFGDSEYGILGKEGNKIYFSKANKSFGYKLYQPTNQNPSVRCLKITDTENKLMVCEGNMLFDKEYDLYYIEK